MTNPDSNDLLRRFDAMPQKNKIILTTEKDAARLELHHPFFCKYANRPFVLPIEVAFLDDDENRFRQDVKQFLMDFKT